MATQATVPKPKSKLKPEDYLQALFGEQDTSQPPHKDRYALLQKKTKSAYHFFLRENPHHVDKVWLQLTVDERLALTKYLRKLCPDDILERAPWLPEELFRNYITRHIYYSQGKEGRKTEYPEGEGGNEGSSKGTKEIGNDDNEVVPASMTRLPPISEILKGQVFSDAP